MDQSVQLEQQLAEIQTKLTSLFNSDNDLQGQSALYAPLVDVATQFQTVYAQQQHGLLALLPCYYKKVSYSVNLVVKQCVLVCLIAKQTGLNKVATIKVLQSAIAQLISTSRQRDHIAAGKPLRAPAIKAYKQRHRTNLIRLKSSLSKMPLLQLDLTARDKQRAHYCEHSKVIDVSYALAKRITLTKQGNVLTLRNAMAGLYFSTDCIFTKQLLTALANAYCSPLPGEYIAAKGKPCMVLGSLDDTGVLCFDTENNTHQQVKNANQVLTKRPIVLSQLNEYLKHWHNLPELADQGTEPYIEHYFSSHDLVSIKKAAYLSIGKLLSELTKNHNAEGFVLTLANRLAHQPVSDLRHAIALVGVEQLPEMLENQQLLQKLTALGKLNWRFVENRVSQFIEFIESYKTVDPHFPTQKVINYALKYIAFNFKLFPHGEILPINKTKPKATLPSLETLTNFYTINKVNLPEQLTQNPFYQIAQNDFAVEKHSHLHAMCYCHLVLFNMFLLGVRFEHLSPLQRDRLNASLSQLEDNQLDNYLTRLFTINMLNVLY